MKEFIEKLIERLGEKALEHGIDGQQYGEDGFSNLENDQQRVAEGIYESIEIVKDLASEHNNGWILCSERLPEVNGKYLVFVSNPTRNDKDCIFTFWYNEYYKEFQEEHDLDYVIAWQPLPALYKKGE